MAESNEQDRTKMNLDAVPAKAYDPANAVPAEVVTVKADADEGRTYNPDGTRNPTAEELTSATGTVNKNVDDNNQSAGFRGDVRNKAKVEALVTERNAYRARGMDDRASAVDAQLEALGYREDKGSTKDTTRAVNPNVEKRA